MKTAATMMVGLMLGMGVTPGTPATHQAQQNKNQAGDQRGLRETEHARATRTIRTALKAVVLIEVAHMGRKGHGAGVLVDGAQGLVVTNAHVVGTRTEVTVVLADGTRAKGQVLYRAARGLDLALVKVDPVVELRRNMVARRRLPQVKVRCAMLRAPDRVTAIGHPGPFRWAVSRGHVAGSFDKSRKLGRGLVLDLTIWHGNSGGGLFDRAGRLVGITTAIFGRTTMAGRVYSGFSFAISGPDLCRFLRKRPPGLRPVAATTPSALAAKAG